MSTGLLQPKAKVTSAPAKLFISLRNGFLPRESSYGCTLSDFAKSNGQSLVLQSPLVKPKLTMGQQSDAYEQEADRVADQVMSMPDPKVQRACPKCGEDEAVRAAPIAARIMPLAQRQAVPEEENDVPVQAISNSLTLQRQEEVPEEEQLQTKQSNITHLVQRQWSDAPKAPSGGAQSRFVTPPSSGWNASEVRVGKIRRIPIEGLTKGYQYLNPHSAAVESANERAIVLIPEAINLQQPVEVLLHLHGHDIGYRQRKLQGSHPALKPGTVRDVDVDRIEQQLEASGRPMIGVLAQGTTSSDFASDFDSDAYLSDVFRVLGNMSIWGQNQAPQIQTVVLSGHSGAAKPITKMMAEPGQPHMPSKLGEVILFDAIHSDQLPTIQTWILRRLDQDLSALTASGLTYDQQISYLRTSLRFRGYYTNTEYAKRYLLLRKAIESWFAKNAAKLGGTSSSVFRDLKDNYQVIAVGHSDHEEIMGRDNRLKDALSALPAISSPTLGSNVSSSNPSSPSSIAPVAPDAGVAEPLRDAGEKDISGAPTTIQRIAIGNQAIKRMLQAKPLSNQLSQIHRKSPTSALDVIFNSQEGAGHPLDNANLKFFGQRMGHDFSGVRVHSDWQSNRAARALNAQAFTAGQDIYFGAESYQLGTPHGDRLLAHELTHVVQQQGMTQQPQTTRGEKDPNKQKIDNDGGQFLFSSGISALGNIRIQRHTLKQRSGQYVGEDPSQNIREEVLNTMDRLHVLWSISNKDFNIEYPRVSALASGSQVSPTIIPLTIAAIERNEDPTLHREVASHFLGLTLTDNVGRGQPNNKSDIQRLQYVLRAMNNLSQADFASESSTVSALSATSVPDATIPKTLSALTEMKIAIASGRSGWQAIHFDEQEFGGDRFGGRTFEHGSFSIFIPSSVRTGANRVHVFFSPGSVKGESGFNAVLTHGLRGASDTSDWILIGVPGTEPGYVTIGTGQISDCLTHVGRSTQIDSLRLSAHSRGYRGLRETISQRLIDTSIVDRIVILDANYSSIARALRRSGIPAGRVIAYNVGTGNLPLPGSRTISLPPPCMRAIGYSRLIQDAIVTRPSLVIPPSIRGQMLTLPDRGCFTTGTVAGGCQVNIVDFCRRNRSAVNAIILQENSPVNGLKQFLDRNDLVRFGRDSEGRQINFGAGIYSHHFFVAEIAHEITD